METKEGRLWAQEAIAYANEMSEDFLLGFVREIKREYSDETTAADAMSDTEAKEFEKMKITFGQHTGMLWGTVSPHYITWLVDHNTPLFRYVKSRRFKDELSSM